MCTMRAFVVLFYHDADVFVALAAMVVPLTAPHLPSSSTSSVITAGSPFAFGYSGMSAKDEPLWASLKKQAAAAKDMLALSAQWMQQRLV